MILFCSSSIGICARLGVDFEDARNVGIHELAVTNDVIGRMYKLEPRETSLTRRNKVAFAAALRTRNSR